MKRSLALGWIFWFFLSLALAVVIYLKHRATESVDTQISLIPGSEASVTIDRPIASNLQASLLFDHKPGQPRPELGRYEHQSTSAGDAYGFFPDPGEPIQIRVRVDDSREQYILFASPLSQGGDLLGRKLLVKNRNLNPDIFPLHQNIREYPVIPAGKSTVYIAVEGVGEKIRGEHVILSIAAPLNFEKAMPGYAWLWPVYFWPLFAIILLIWLALLVRATKKG
jgi:hypothetical protein